MNAIEFKEARESARIVRDRALADAEAAFETAFYASDEAYCEASEHLDDEIDEQEEELVRLQHVCMDAYAAADTARQLAIMVAHEAYDETVEPALTAALG